MILSDIYNKTNWVLVVWAHQVWVNMMDLMDSRTFQIITQLSEILQDSGEIGEFDLDIFNIKVNSLQTYEKDLEDFGVNIVIYANQLLRASYPAMLNAAKSILLNSRAKESEEFLISINDFQNNHNSNFISPFQYQTVSDNNIIAKLSTDCCNGCHVEQPTRIYFGPTDITKLEIKI